VDLEYGHLGGNSRSPEGELSAREKYSGGGMPWGCHSGRLGRHSERLGYHSGRLGVLQWEITLSDSASDYLCVMSQWKW